MIKEEQQTNASMYSKTEQYRQQRQYFADFNLIFCLNATQIVDMPVVPLVMTSIMFSLFPLPFLKRT